MEEEENQREMKRLKEKEKKEANEALMQELSEWEKEIFTKNVLKELRSMWEVEEDLCAPVIHSFYRIPTWKWFFIVSWYTGGIIHVLLYFRFHPLVVFFGCFSQH